MTFEFQLTDFCLFCHLLCSNEIGRYFFLQTVYIFMPQNLKDGLDIGRKCFDLDLHEPLTFAVNL